ncbi:MAG TPA: hypothetical protein VHU91_02055 [Mycobacteriales bacterium]|jgi:hypothetical protein|nr:hypothetical protein [Mycobacteriales bacterium]
MTAPVTAGTPAAPPTTAHNDRATIAEKTLRTDRWWVTPLLTFLGLAAFVVYGLARAFMNKWYWVEDSHLLAPFYSPCLSESCVPGSSHILGQPIPKLPDFLSWVSPAMFVLILPGGFRMTCYYYRKSYYRSFWFSPPACAVPDGHKTYSGETRFPLIFQNIHRYFFYAAVLVGAVLTFDMCLSFKGKDGGIGMGIGSIILVINAILIWAYTLGCHSCRNIIGGRLKHFSKHPVRYRLWGWVSKLNAKHQPLAWASMFSVMIADAYVMLVASGAITDVRIFN